MNVKKIAINELSSKIDSIVALRNKWCLVTAEHDGVVDTLTAGWGALGNVWEKKTAIVYIRPQRHTKTSMDASGRFTMTFFDHRRKELLFLGSHSGADMPDKIRQSGLNLTTVDGQPTFEEGKMVVLCKILYTQQIAPENFVDPALAEENYPDQDYSYVYVAEIEAAYEMMAE